MAELRNPFENLKGDGPWKTSNIADAFNVSITHVLALFKQAQLEPDAKKGRAKFWSRASIETAMRVAAEVKAEKPATSLNEAKIRKLNAEIARIEFANQVKEGKYVEVNLIVQLLWEYDGRMAATLERVLKNELPSKFTKTTRTNRAICIEACNRLKREIQTAAQIFTKKHKLEKP